VNTQPEETRRGRHVTNDLAELKGIGPKYAEVLKSIGVDSIKELSHRNPEYLKEMIETRHGKVVGLSEHECQKWIEEAKAFVATSPIDRRDNRP
jgi:predicted flap endonuclease-1-like 5' DNA nuclease